MRAHKWAAAEGPKGKAATRGLRDRTKTEDKKGGAAKPQDRAAAKNPEDGAAEPQDGAMTKEPKSRAEKKTGRVELNKGTS